MDFVHFVLSGWREPRAVDFRNTAWCNFRVQDVGVERLVSPGSVITHRLFYSTLSRSVYCTSVPAVGLHHPGASPCLRLPVLQSTNMSVWIFSVCLPRVPPAVCHSIKSLHLFHFSSSVHCNIHSTLQKQSDSCRIAPQSVSSNI